MTGISRLERLNLALKALGLEPLSPPIGKLSRATEALERLKSQIPLSQDGLTMLEREAVSRGLLKIGEVSRVPTESDDQ